MKLLKFTFSVGFNPQEGPKYLSPDCRVQVPRSKPCNPLSASPENPNFSREITGQVTRTISEIARLNPSKLGTKSRIISPFSRTSHTLSFLFKLDFHHDSLHFSTIRPRGSVLASAHTNTRSPTSFHTVSTLASTQNGLSVSVPACRNPTHACVHGAHARDYSPPNKPICREPFPRVATKGPLGQ